MCFLTPHSALTNPSLSTPHLLPLLIQSHNFVFHLLLHTFPQRLYLPRHVPVLPRLFCTSFLFSLPLLLDLHITLVVAVWTELRSGMFNLDHYFLTVATVLEDIWGKSARSLWSWAFGDGRAAWTDGLVDEAHVCWPLWCLRARLMKEML